MLITILPHITEISTAAKLLSPSFMFCCFRCVFMPVFILGMLPRDSPWKLKFPPPEIFEIEASGYGVMTESINSRILLLDTVIVQQPKTLAYVNCPDLGTDTFSQPAENLDNIANIEQEPCYRKEPARCSVPFLRPMLFASTFNLRKVKAVIA